jgi:outer membrane immunogenic protein
MKKFLLSSALVFAGIAASGISASAATLDDVMAQLESMQRDNQAIRRDNVAMRKELAALRQNDARSTRQAVAPANAPVRGLTPAVSSAMAADMPVKAGGYFPPPQAFSWSGFYLGLHAGYNWSSNNWGTSIAFEQPSITASPFSPKTNGVLGGVQAGANYQLGSWVVGMEADWAFAHGKGSANGVLIQGGAPAPSIFATATSQIDWVATFAGRAGYAFDLALFYAKGGVAAAEFKDNFAIASTPPNTPSFIDFGTKTNIQVGWVAGGGVEYAFAPNWSGKIEYNYIDLGKSREIFNVFVNTATLTFPEDIHHKLQIVKVGANYRFN